MVSRDELLKSIQPEMKLTKNFFMQIYGYELTWTGFSDQALTKLEQAGCSRAREYYIRFVDEYEKEHVEIIKRVAEWYIKEIDKKGSESSWKREEFLQEEENLLREKKRILMKKLLSKSIED